MNLSVPLFWVAIGQTIFILGVVWILPLIARKEYLFGVYLGVERSKIRASAGIYKLWHWSILGIGAAAMLSCYGLWLSSWRASALVIPLMAVVALGITAFLKCNALARHYGVRTPQMALMPVEEIPFLREPVPMLLQVLPWILVALVMTWSAFRWGHVPAEFPVAWKDGAPVEWESRTWVRVFFGPMLAFASLLVPLHMLTWTASRSKPQLKAPSTSKPKRSARAVLRAFVWYLWGLGMLMAVVVGYVHWDAVRSMTGAIPLGRAPVVIAFSLTTATLLACVLLAIRAFRLIADGGKSGIPTEQLQSKWVVGLFYFNPEDPAFLILPKYGSSLIVNFGNRNALVIALVCAILALSLLLLPLFYFLMS